MIERYLILMKQTGQDAMVQDNMVCNGIAWIRVDRGFAALGLEAYPPTSPGRA